MEFDDGDVIGILSLLLVVGLAVVSVGFGLAVATVRAGRTRSTAEGEGPSAAVDRGRSWPTALLVSATAAVSSAVSGALLEADVRLVVLFYLVLSAALGYLVGRLVRRGPGTR